MESHEVAVRPSRDPTSADLAVDGLERQRLDTLKHNSLELRAVVERQQSADSSYLAVARISVLAPRLWAGLVSDELALVATPLGLSRGGLAQIVVVGLPTKSKNAARCRPC